MNTKHLARLVICLLGLFAVTEVRAGVIGFTIVANGATIQIGTGSPLLAGSSSNSASVNTAALNSLLAGAGSAYRFSSLGASSSADLTLSGTLQMVGPGSTSLTITETESGLTSPASAANLQNSLLSVGSLNSTQAQPLALTVPSLPAAYADLNDPIYLISSSSGQSGAAAITNPEPATWSLLGISLAVLTGVVYRRRKSRTVSS